MEKSDLSEEQMAAKHESVTGSEIETGGYIVIGGRACGESGRIQSWALNTLQIHYTYITDTLHIIITHTRACVCELITAGNGDEKTTFC